MHPSSADPWIDIHFDLRRGQWRDKPVARLSNRRSADVLDSYPIILDYQVVGTFEHSLPNELWASQFGGLLRSHGTQIA